jgi:hypothetical protein
MTHANLVPVNDLYCVVVQSVETNPDMRIFQVSMNPLGCSQQNGMRYLTLLSNTR